MVRLRQVVLDAVDIRALSEFYRRLLGYRYRPGDEPPPAGGEDERARDWLVLRDASGGAKLAFQAVTELPAATWPAGPVPQQLHLDLTVTDKSSLLAEHHRVLALGATLLEDRHADEDEPLFVYADPAGHPFCVFVASESGPDRA